METWNCWRKNIYDARVDENRVEIADSYLSPTKSDPEDSRDDQQEQKINTNKDLIGKNEQSIGSVEEKTTWIDRDSDTWDFEQAAIVALGDDTDWHDLDLSGIVGTKAMEIILHVDGTDNAAGSEIRVRTNGYTGNRGTGVVHTHVASQSEHNNVGLKTDDDGVIEIKCDPKPSNWTSIGIFVRRYHRA